MSTPPCDMWSHFNTLRPPDIGDNSRQFDLKSSLDLPECILLFGYHQFTPRLSHISKFIYIMLLPSATLGGDQVNMLTYTYPLKPGGRLK